MLSMAEKEKSPGASGYNIAPFRHLWHSAKRELMGFFAELHDKCVFQKELECHFYLFDSKSARG